jgi:hypothetical protein
MIKKLEREDIVKIQDIVKNMDALGWPLTPEVQELIRALEEETDQENPIYHLTPAEISVDHAWENNHLELDKHMRKLKIIFKC